MPTDDPGIERFLDCVKQAKRIVASYREAAPSAFDPQATGIAIAIGGAAVIAAGATAYSASSAANSAKEANKTNKEIAASDRALQYQQFLKSRGSEGSAILPMYPSFTDKKVEEQLGNQAFATYLAEQQALGTPEEQIKAYQAIVNGLEPSMVAGDQLVNQLFNGDLERQQQQNIAPVLAARGAVAGAQKQGILEGLIAENNAISASRARAGYQGGGSAFEKSLLTRSTIPALQAAATVGAQADLANASDVAGIKQADINTRLNNLSLPLTQAGNRLQFQALPATAAGATFRNSLQPFDWFKLNPGTPGWTPSPYVTPVPGVGAIVGAGVAQGASTLGNYFANRSLINQVNQRASQPAPFTTDQYFQNQRMMDEYYGAGAYGTSPYTPSAVVT